MPTSFNEWTEIVSGVLQKRKYENAMTIDKKSWGYRQDARLDEYYTTKDLIKGEEIELNIWKEINNR